MVKKIKKIKGYVTSKEHYNHLLRSQSQDTKEGQSSLATSNVYK